MSDSGNEVLIACKRITDYIYNQGQYLSERRAKMLNSIIDNMANKLDIYSIGTQGGLNFLFDDINIDSKSENNTLKIAVLFDIVAILHVLFKNEINVILKNYNDLPNAFSFGLYEDSPDYQTDAINNSDIIRIGSLGLPNVDIIVNKVLTALGYAIQAFPPKYIQKL